MLRESPNCREQIALSSKGNRVGNKQDYPSVTALRQSNSVWTTGGTVVINTKVGRLTEDNNAHTIFNIYIPLIFLLDFWGGKHVFVDLFLITPALPLVLFCYGDSNRVRETCRSLLFPLINYQRPHDNKYDIIMPRLHKKICMILTSSAYTSCRED